MQNNKNLQTAKVEKNDEFYTRIEDVEAELQHYTKHFAGKVVYCNFDDPSASAFWQYFYQHFAELGLKKLIATHINLNYKTEYDGHNDVTTKLQKPGDFRSPECIELLKEADVVCTNPAFSLFKELIPILVENGKDFLIISNKNLETGETIGFDWEIRDDYWEDGKFPFDTLGQFERKFDPAKAIKLSIQCSKNCSAIVVAWHEDFAEEKVTDIQLATDSPEKENGKTRYTKHFRVFRFDEMELFKQLISKAFQTKTYNHTIFDTAESEKGVQPSNPPICPKCGRPLLRKTNKNTGTIFWGCSGYRRDGAGCNYTKKIEE